jgi:hypothetical protein
MYISRLRHFAGILKRELFYRLDGRNNRHCARLAARYMLPDGFRRIYHFHIRKTGGTSLNTIFLSTCGEDGKNVYTELNNATNHRVIKNDKIFQGWNPKLIRQGDFYYAFSHLPAHQIALPPKTFTITCLRDPIRRLLSLYRMLQEQIERDDQHPGLKAQKHYLRPHFVDFVDALPEWERLNQLYMFSEQMDIKQAYEAIKKCNIYFFTEDFNAGIAQINEKLRLSLRPIHLRAGKKQIVLADQDLKYLRQRLYQEYQLLALLQQ